ncbi:MAG: AarF/ABC1/UbiB kinase family protein [Bradymonadales bacterium]|nr:MAG: AarF/ABC1/UbiB kinase family protein [Bradymonadales bacterium]
MTWAIPLRKQISNWSRFQEIMRTLAKHGLSAWLEETDLPLPKGLKSAHPPSEEAVPTHLRQAFEELGPTFIKLGQILSTRPDLLPADYIKEFSKLTDQIPAIGFSEVRSLLEAEMGRPLSDVFESFEKEALAAASISQVHRARLAEGEIKEVVVKVQRPGIESDIQSDIQILYFVAGALERFRKAFRLYNLTGMVEEFQRSIYEELDFSLEAKNIEAFSEHAKEIEGVEIPKVVWPLSSKRVLTMSELKGSPLSRLEVFPETVDRSYLSESVARFFLEGIFFNGLFHCDAHSGNLLISLEGKGRVGIVDFGMVGRLSPELREKLGRLFLSLVTQDYQSLVRIYSEIADFGGQFNLRAFKRDVERLLQPNLGRPLKEVDVGQLMMDSVQLAHKYQIRLPKDLILFYRSIVTLEHCCRRLDPDFTFSQFGRSFSRLMIRKRFSLDSLSKDFLRMIDGLRSLSSDLPLQLKHLLTKLEENSLFPQLKGIEEALLASEKRNRALALSVILSGLLISSALLLALQPQHPLNWVLWPLTGVVGIFTAFKLRKAS